MVKEKILLAGGTGYLGSYIRAELLRKGYPLRTVVRDKPGLTQAEGEQVVEAQLTEPATLAGLCEDIEVVISTVGITRQREGFTYLEVDYQANLNLLWEAQRAGVKKFMYVSVLHGEKLRHLKICQAKEMFVDELKASGLQYAVIRPSGFFSDMTAFMEQAAKGRVWLAKGGACRFNPMHGFDLAERIVAVLTRWEEEVLVGGPEVFSHRDAALLAFEVLGRRPVIQTVPDWVRRLLLRVLRACTPSTFYGPLEFFLTVLAMDMEAPAYGRLTLREHFESLSIQNL